MANVGTAYVTIAPSMKGFASKTSSLLNGQAGSLGSSAGSEFTNKFQSSGSGKIGTAMGAIAGVAGAVATTAFNAIGSSMGAAISRVDQLNNFPKVMQNLGYSSEDASRSIQNMSNAIDGLPTSLDSLSNMTQQLAPLCSNLDEATNISIALNNAMLAGGKGSAEVSRAMTQYTQALSKGKPDLMDWRTLQEVMPGQLNQIAQAMLGAGKNSNDLYSALKNGTITMTDFNNAVLKLNSEGFDGFASFEQQARDATQGIGTALTNIQNRIAKAGETIINAFGATRISGAINAFSSSFGVIAKTVAPAFTLLGNLLEKNVEVYKILGATIKNKVTPVINSFNSEIQKVKPVIDALSSSFDPLKNKISRVFSEIIHGTANLKSITSTFDVVKRCLSDAFNDDAINQFINSAKTKLSELASGGLIDGLSERLSTIGEINFAGVNITPILENVINKVQTINSFLMSTGTQIVNFFKTVGDGITNAFSGFDISNLQVLFNLGTLVTPMGLLTTALSQIGEVLSNTIGTVLQSLAPVIVSIIQTALNLVQSLTPTLINLGSIISSVLATGLNVIMIILQALTPVFSIICNLVAQIMPTLGTLAGTVLQSLMTVISLVASTISQIASAVLPVVLSVIQMITPFIQQIATLIAQLVTSLAPLISQLISSLVPVIQSILNAIQPLVQAGLTVIMSLISALLPVISNIISVIVSVVSTLISVLTPVLSVIIGIITTVINVIATIISAVSPIVSFVLGVVATIISSIGNVLNIVTGIIATVAGVVSGIIGLVTSFVSNVISFISGLVSSVVGFFAGLASSIISTVTTMWSNVVNGFSQGVTNAVNFVKDLPNQIIQFFSNAGTWLVESGKSIINGFINGIKSAISGAIDTVSGFVGQIRNLFPFSPAKTGPFSGHGWVIYSGMSIMNALAEGVEKRAGATVRTVKGVMQDVANTASVNAGMNLAYEAGASLNLARSNLASMTSSQANTTERVIEWLDNNLGSIINQNAPQTVIDNDAGALIVDNRLVQLQRKAGMNRG